jgi:hypothetical protein
MPPLMSADKMMIYLIGTPVEGGKSRKIKKTDLGGQQSTWRFNRYGETNEHHPLTTRAAISDYNGPLLPYLQNFTPAPVVVILPTVEAVEH